LGKSKYEHVDYWINKVEIEENLWEGLFENKPIKKGSLIVSPVILNSYNNLEETSFAVYPDSKSVIGFLRYTYLPTAFNSIFDHESDDYIIDDNLGDFFSELINNHPDKVELIEHMVSLYNDLNVLFDYDDDQAKEGLIKWTDSFNEDWLSNDGIILSFHIFTSPAELVEEVIRVYEEDLTIEMFEEDLGFSAEAFRRLASDDIYTNELKRKSFTDILMSRLGFSF